MEAKRTAQEMLEIETSPIDELKSIMIENFASSKNA